MNFNLTTKKLQLKEVLMNYCRRFTKYIFGIFLIFLSIASSFCLADIRFEEVLDGPVKPGGHTDTWGAAWGDFNNDQRPDLWLSNHILRPGLWMNDENQMFRDIASQALSSNVSLLTHTHGAAWADFDNDGDMDLLETIGLPANRRSNHPCVNLFKNDDMGLSNISLSQFFFDCGEARAPVWLDQNNDGLLDLFVVAYGGSHFLQQTKNGFVEKFFDVDVETESKYNFGQLSDFSGDGRLNLVATSASELKIYDVNEDGVTDISDGLGIGPETNMLDTITGDFNGDLHSDLFVVRAVSYTSGFAQSGDADLRVRLFSEKSEKGIAFKSIGELTFKLDPYGFYFGRFPLDKIYIGAQGVHPESLQFTLSNKDVGTQGLMPHAPGEVTGLYIGYDPINELWNMRLSSNRATQNEPWDNVNAMITSAALISNVVPMGFTQDNGALRDQLWQFNNGRYEEFSALAGLVDPTACVSGVSGDFDNDMDLDIYLACTGPISNIDNILLENQGDGVFVRKLGAGGAAGTALGRGETVIAADFDVDGFLDLFITNGKSLPSGPPTVPRGPNQLYKNLGNKNHWIELDVEGVVSNRDGIGATVLVTAGGVTQYREVNGGMHRYAQNHRRIHFGLANNNKVERIIINWPSGIVQELKNVPADQLIHVVEPISPDINGVPTYKPGVDEGVFLWKTTFDGPYHLRVNGDGTLTNFTIKLLSSEPMIEVSGYSLEIDDELIEQSHGFSLDAYVGSWEDGVNFRVPQGAKILISVEKDGKVNPRYLHVGATGQPLSPVGWVISTGELEQGSVNWNDKGWGFLIEKTGADDKVNVEWRSNANKHLGLVKILSSTSLRSVAPFSFESSDSFTHRDNFVEAKGWVGNWWRDGINVVVDEPSELGFIFEMDGITTTDKLKIKGSGLGFPNAYWVPQSSSTGKPEYDPGLDAGLFLWQDTNGSWQLRASAGGNVQRYIGRIVSDLPFENIQPYSVESADILRTSDPYVIEFDLTARRIYEDGFSFLIPVGANVSFELVEPVSVGSVYVGKDRWPVSQSTFTLSGASLPVREVNLQFEETTELAGISHKGETWGASWGDANGDGLPDLWVSNHLKFPSLYINKGDATFSDRASELISNWVFADTHGAAWADYDNDGDQDLLEVSGGGDNISRHTNHFYRNDGGILIDVATEVGLGFPEGRGRTPVWFDFDNDGWLDVVISNQIRAAGGGAPSVLLQQLFSSFSDMSSYAGFDISQPSEFAQLSDLSGDGLVDLMAHDKKSHPQSIYEGGSLPYQNIAPALGFSDVSDVVDSAIADFNGDLRPDVFSTRTKRFFGGGGPGRPTLGSDAVQIDQNTIHAFITTKGDGLYSSGQGIDFKAEGEVNFKFILNKLKLADVFIGATGANPAQGTFSLSTDDPSVYGLINSITNEKAGLFIGFDSSNQIWQVRFINPVWDKFSVIITSDRGIRELTPLGFEPYAPSLKDILMIASDAGLEDKSEQAGLDLPTSCISVAAGDFDNDMDVDLYLACTGQAANVNNVLYKNKGDGTFEWIPDAAGASGSIWGLGESVAIADYDEDGFLDVFVTNGQCCVPFDKGPHQLFRNSSKAAGNRNHWIQLDLEGVKSNRDGIGARVLATTGSVIQLREQNGGMHLYSQNHKRLHFGLGAYQKVDKLEIHWPSGEVQVLQNLAADQVVHVREP